MAEVTVQSELIIELCEKAIKDEKEQEKNDSNISSIPEIYTLRYKLIPIRNLALLAETITIDDKDIKLLIFYDKGK